MGELDNDTFDNDYLDNWCGRLDNVNLHNGDLDVGGLSNGWWNNGGLDDGHGNWFCKLFVNIYNSEHSTNCTNTVQNWYKHGQCFIP